MPIPGGDIDAMEAAVLDATSNATLLTVTAPGAPDRSGDPGTGSVLWQGEARGFLARERHETVSGGAQLPVRLDSFVLFARSAPVLEVAGPDWESTTVTIRDDRLSSSSTTDYRVTGMELDANGLLDSVLLTLDEVGV